MLVVSIVILALAPIPLGIAWRANQNTTLRHALGWAWLAWIAWFVYGISPGVVPAYAALTLTACSGIAVLGARRPGVLAWDFVVLSLLIVLWLGWAEGLLAGAELKLGMFRFVFICVLLATTILNYLPTRFGIGAASLGVSCTLALVELFLSQYDNPAIKIFAIAVAPWIAWMSYATRPRQKHAANETWFRFRDQFGAVWAERVREQFNRAAVNAHWPVELRWSGFKTSETAIRPEWTEALIALQKRFRSENG